MEGQMIQVIGYLIACLFLAGVFTFVFSMMRSIKKVDDAQSWKTIVGLFIFFVFAPYGFCEAMTRAVGADLTDQAKQIMKSESVKGELRFYRVLFYNGSEARIVVVAKEDATWGGTERPVMAATVTKDGDEWKISDQVMVNSMERNKDSMTLPPYW